jgi:hypothetical protein
MQRDIKFLFHTNLNVNFIYSYLIYLKKSKKLNFSGKGLAGLLLLSVQFVSILIIFSNLHL